MLRFRLRAKDLPLVWNHDGRGWSAGQSYIHPYDHRALEAFAYLSPTRMLFAVCERLSCRGLSGQSKNVPNLCNIEDEQLDRVLRDLSEYQLDFILMIVTLKRQPNVKIHCSQWGTAPVYILHSCDGKLWGDWNPANLYKLMRCRFLDVKLLSAYIVGADIPYASSTLFPEIKLLTQRSWMEWNSASDKLRITYPQPLPGAVPCGLKEEADVLAAFQDILTVSMSRWLERESVIFAELSGGLDSAVVSIMGTLLSDNPVRTFGLIMPGDIGLAQQSRRKELIDRFNFIDCSLDAEAYTPFSDKEGRMRGKDIIPWQEHYEEAFLQLVARAKDAGCDMLFSGVGGDELFIRYRAEVDEEERSMDTDDVLWEDVPDCVTALTRDIFRDYLCDHDKAPAGQAASSVFSSAAAVSTLYLSQGIWPVNPLSTPELVRFCRRLPREWRMDKKLERDLLSRFGCSRNMTHPAVTESFVPVMELSLRQYARLQIRDILRESRLADLGLIRRDKLLIEYDRYCETGKPGLDAFFYNIVILELTLRSLE